MRPFGTSAFRAESMSDGICHTCARSGSGSRVPDRRVGAFSRMDHRSPIMAGIFALEFSPRAKYLGAADGRIYDMLPEIWPADIEAAKANFLAGEQVVWRARHGQSPEGRA